MIGDFSELGKSVQDLEFLKAPEENRKRQQQIGAGREPNQQERMAPEGRHKRRSRMTPEETPSASEKGRAAPAPEEIETGRKAAPEPHQAHGQRIPEVIPAQAHGQRIPGQRRAPGITR